MTLPLEKLSDRPVQGTREHRRGTSNIVFGMSHRELTYRGGRGKEKTVLDTGWRENDTFGE